MHKIVRVFTTGGTIEKSYSEWDGTVKNRTSLLKAKLVRKLRLPYTEIDVVEIMAKDSLDMSDDDRQEILNFIRDEFRSGCPIIILHGTDTMEQTLRFCYENEKQPPVPVVFTGAMRPAGFDNSDALQNFTEALYAAQMAEPGFYISFHGRLFKAPHVKKDRDKLTFVVTD